MEYLNLLEELDSISKIHTLKREDIDALMIEFAGRILATLKIERMSVWLFNETGDAIISIGEYELGSRAFSKNNMLQKSKYPAYFTTISQNSILLAENVRTNPATSELNNDYNIPHNITSLMDIPLRIGGELVGIMCFEKTGKNTRTFSVHEQTFALGVAIVLASSLEARHRRALQQKLNEELAQKELLLKEIHHRVKNNLSIISSLISLQSGKVKDEYHKSLFDEHRSKIDSIALIHKLVYKSKHVSDINIKDYIGEIASNLNQAYVSDKRKVEMIIDVDDVVFDLDLALPLGLIVNEVITNSFKHAFNGRANGQIKLKLTSGEKKNLMVTDNGRGFDPLIEKKNTLGMEILAGLVYQIGGQYKFENKQGTVFSMEF